MSTFAASSLWIFVALNLPLLEAQKNLAGTAEAKLALAGLNTFGRVLMIAAHPDDENTAVLAYFARGRHMRTAYLSITRGEGGQNLIGSEQGDLLGIIRTQELLAARQIDGAEQFFTRAIDFGFSKTAAETFEKWGHDNLLADVVWVIRKYRPEVIILRFSGTPRDGHGQHQASATLGREAFFAAADPARFPEQLRYVQPWKATRVMWNMFSFGPEQEKEAERTPGRVMIDTGVWNPLLGKSYTEIASISRGMHHSQGTGALERRGTSKNFFVTIGGEPAREDPFDGVDTTWTRVPGGTAVGRILSDAGRSFIPEHPEKTIPLLLEARRLIADNKDPAAQSRLEEVDDTIALCAGLWLDAETDRYAAVPGETVHVRATALNRSPHPIALAGVGLNSAPDSRNETLAYNIPATRNFEWKVPAEQPFSQPFWLVRPHSLNLYSIEDQNLIGVPDAAPLLRAQFRLKLGGAEMLFSRPVKYRYVDSVEGERTRPLVVVPEVAVNFPEGVLIFPSERSRAIRVQVRANRAPIEGEVHLELESGWKAEPETRPFHLAEAGSQQVMWFDVTPPPGEASAKLHAIATVGKSRATSGMTVIAYPHIPRQTVFPPSVAKAERADIRVLARKVGYVMGAGDEVPDALRQIGCQVTLLGGDDLAGRDLGEFDAIVIGVRAYNVRADLRANQQRLLDYVESGGALIVQYNIPQGGAPGSSNQGEISRIGPFPLQVGRDRVTVEEAPVTFTDPRSPLLNFPNKITERDFQHWIQERGLYFASQWDPHYQPVVETHDPGEKPLAGGMLYARYGKGVYIFSAFSWFRELPAGVPGAYRIFANMLSAGKAQGLSAAGVR